MNIPALQATITELARQIGDQRTATVNERNELLAHVDRTFETVSKQLQELRLTIEASYKAQVDADTVMLIGTAEDPVLTNR